MELLTRTQAIKEVGLKNVERVEAENCEPTSRCLEAHEKGLTEWSAQIAIKLDEWLAIYYMTDENDEKVFAATDALYCIDWSKRIVGYKIK